MASVDVLVIGGGPSAYGALLALVSAGLRPTLLTPQGAWLRSSEDPGSSSKSGLARKARFGSTAMYRYPTEAGVGFDVAGPVPVSAVPGGLSTVWGSNIQVFSGRDLAAWGASADAMEFAYRAILEKVPHQGAADRLSDRFPWPVVFPGTQPLTPRVRRALHRARGRSSAAVLIGLGRNATAPVGLGCIACGQCLDGCPEGVIFDAGPAIARLVVAHDLPVIDGVAVSVSEVGDGSAVEYIDRESGGRSLVDADRVLLAAGSIATSALLVRSCLAPGDVVLDDTQVFYTPLLPTMGPERGQTSFTLAQMFVTGSGSPRALDFHLSLYESDPSFASRAEGLVGPLARLVPARAYRQLMAAIGFIPTDFSGRIRLSRSDGPGAVDVTVSTESNPASAAYVREVLRTVRGPLRDVGMHVISPLAQVSDVGASYHVGHLTSGGRDVVETASGAIGSSGSVRVVDGAALPVVPTGPVTLTMMANAYRIAREMGGAGGA
jgi:ferredoxin